MCIIIDACALSSVFNNKTKDHSEFAPVLRWIVVGEGKIVYGGSTYINELKNTPKYLKIFRELEKHDKVAEVEKLDVDQAERDIKSKSSNPRFNDAHILAIIVSSGCILVCTKERTLNKFFKGSSFYPKTKMNHPKFYLGKRNEKLLSDKNIVGFCKPKVRGTRLLKDLFGM